MMYFFSLTSAGSLFVLILSDFIIATEISWQGLFKTSVFQSSFQYLLQLTLLVGNNKKTHISSGFQSLWNWKHCQGPSLVLDNTCLSSPWSLRGQSSCWCCCRQLNFPGCSLVQTEWLCSRVFMLNYFPAEQRGRIVCLFLLDMKM